MKVFRTARKRIEVSVGESVRIVRELQMLSQNRLAEMTGIRQATISAIENDRVRLGVQHSWAGRLATEPCNNFNPDRMSGNLTLRKSGKACYSLHDVIMGDPLWRLKSILCWMRMSRET